VGLDRRVAPPRRRTRRGPINCLSHFKYGYLGVQLFFIISGFNRFEGTAPPRAVDRRDDTCRHGGVLADLALHRTPGAKMDEAQSEQLCRAACWLGLSHRARMVRSTAK
jgi:hypothetical protein